MLRIAGGSPIAQRAAAGVAIAVVAGLLVLIGFFAWLIEVLVQPAPPRSVTMSTGPVDGAYHTFALRYRAHLARYGVDLILKQSNGSLENLARLRERRDGVQVALVQGGITTASEAPGIMTLGSLFYEPVFLARQGAADVAGSVTGQTHRRRRPRERGPGTHAAAAAGERHRWSRRAPRRSGGLEAAQKLESGALDAAVFVNAPEAPAIQRLLRAQAIRLGNTDRVDAYVRRFPFLHKVVLPAGAMDLAGDVPARDQVLIAATANLLATEDLHPVIVDLLLEAARKVHGSGSLLNGAGEIPALLDRELPVSEDAERIYRGEYSFLRRYLPFWAAVWVQRFMFFAIPLLAIGIPLLRCLPIAYQWRTRRRIYRWYGELKLLELACTAARAIWGATWSA